MYWPFIVSPWVVHILYLLSCWVMCEYMFLFVQHLSPSSGKRNLIYCGEPIPCGLGEYLTRSGLPEFCSSLATAMKE